jgi:hypothetical protein
MLGKRVWELLALPCLRSPVLLGAFETDGLSGGAALAILLAVVGAHLGSLWMLELLLLRSLARDRVHYLCVWMDRGEGARGLSLDH